MGLYGLHVFDGCFPVTVPDMVKIEWWEITKEKLVNNVLSSNYVLHSLEFLNNFPCALHHNNIENIQRTPLRNRSYFRFDDDNKV